MDNCTAMKLTFGLAYTVLILVIFWWGITESIRTYRQSKKKNKDQSPKY